MKRTFVTAAPLAPAALGALKDWLGIAPTTAGEDAGLSALLRAALESCEAFIGTLPLQASCEEVFEAGPGWQTLATRPVQAIVAVQGLLPGDVRIDLPPGAFAIDLSADGGGRVRVNDAGPARRLVVRFTAGLAPGWASLPDGLRHGVVRLAADAYRQRDAATGTAQPPAAVAALWRPWRAVRLL